MSRSWNAVVFGPPRLFCECPFLSVLGYWDLATASMRLHTSLSAGTTAADLGGNIPPEAAFCRLEARLRSSAGCRRVCAQDDAPPKALSPSNPFPGRAHIRSAPPRSRTSAAHTWRQASSPASRFAASVFSISPRKRTSPARPASAIATALRNFDVSNATKGTEGATRQKAHQIGVSLDSRL